jgi:hypothetical protein
LDVANSIRPGSQASPALILDFRFMRFIMAILVGAVAVASMPAADTARITGELKQWHKVTLTLDGPAASETGSPNPFTDYRMTVTFTHGSGSPVYRVPGYFAADGDAAESSATEGNQWRAHLSPDKTGEWRWAVSFVN